MTARFRPEGPYGFSGAENARLSGETRAAHSARDCDYCGLVVARAEMNFLRAYRACPDGVCRRARCCIGRAFSCRAMDNPRLLGFLEEGAAIDFAYAELQHAREARSRDSSPRPVYGERSAPKARSRASSTRYGAG